jgi:branched-chain amino acid transport system ATP-binding protein
MMAMLEVKGVTMCFGGLVAVDNVAFEVNQGEIVSIIGPNGAGKTTIFNILTGVYKPAEGELIFEGNSIRHKSPQEIVKAGIARTFQNLRVFKNMRMIENVLVGNHRNIHYSFFDLVFRTKKFRAAEKDAAQKVVDILGTVGLVDKLHTYAGDLPYGEQRRLEIARAMATGAKLLLLDEPAAGMNTTETESLLEFIKKLRDKGFTVLLIEHDMNLVMNISDRIYVLDFGKMIASGLPEEIAINPQVIEAYLGRSEENAAN